ncbi:MAG: TRAP transporter small permease [Paracoccaceae bacterium]
MSQSYEPKTALGRFVNEIEETMIALLLGGMTIITFINVVLRYGFGTGLIWGLELTTFLFAWLVLFGVSYGVKVTAHLGVDVVVNLFSPTARKVLGLFAAAVCIIYAALVLKGAWDYWANFANLPQTTGRWFPTGFEEMTRTSYRSWYEVIDIPMPGWLTWIEPLINEGEAYEKIPRFIPYAILPFGMALLLFRFIQATVRLIRGETDSLIVSHEAEEAVDDVKHMNAGD